MQQHRALITPATESNADRALRYRKRALQTRVAAAAVINQAARERLLKRAADFDAIANMYDSKGVKPHA